MFNSVFLEVHYLVSSYTSLHTCVRVYVCLCIYAYACVCICVFLCMFVCARVCLYICLCVYECMCVYGRPEKTVFGVSYFLSSSSGFWRSNSDGHTCEHLNSLNYLTGRIYHLKCFNWIIVTIISCVCVCVMYLEWAWHVSSSTAVEQVREEQVYFFMASEITFRSPDCAESTCSH